MRLIAARLERVRQHRLLELNLAPGFTLIGGANETGKSTVVEALHKALFLKATATGRGVEELRSLTHGGLPEVELRFEADGQPWLLRKRFAGSGGTCQLSGSSGPTLQGSAAETRLAALLQVSGPIEGRRIAQLPQRWAHLWVRQGEAGSDLLGGNGEAYDLPQLVQQLQRSGDGAALAATTTVLESPLDRLVQQQLQQELDLQLTTTGKVRAGSPLALAQNQENEARTALALAEQRLAELEAAMADLRQIGTRLDEILEQGQRLGQLRLLVAETEPLRQRHQHLHALQAQQLGLQHQQLVDQRQLETLHQQLDQLQQQQQQHRAAMASLSERRTALAQQLNQAMEQQEVLTAQRDLALLAREEQQLISHKSQFDALQQQANAIKLQLQDLPAISPEQVRQLRQAEQQLAQAQARCQGMAARLELLCSDQPVQLEGQPLTSGEQQLLEQPTVVHIGSGTRIRVSPGGGGALGDARDQRQQAATQLAQLQAQLGLACSEAGDTLAQQRLALERELANLRQTAQTIPWARLDAQLAELVPRRQRLLNALAQLGGPPPERNAPPGSDLAALEASQESLKRQTQALSHGRTQLEQELQGQQQQLEQLVKQAGQRQAEADRLSGALAAAERQLALLQEQHGTVAQLAEAAQHLETQLQASRGRIEALRQQDGSAAGREGIDPETQLQQLQSEKEALLSRRGQQEQLCRSLGAHDPAAEVEQRQAAWEQAQAEWERIQQRTAALQLLLETFHSAQQQAADHYCQPLQAALQGYLDALELPVAGLAHMGYDPQQGFGDLQLQQDGQRYAFGQLSGGMREQLGAALRLALAEVLQGAYGGCLPLVFDDAFSNSDPQRRTGVMQMLQRGVERGVQILMFSCTPADFEGLAVLPGSGRIDLPGRP